MTPISKTSSHQPIGHDVPEALDQHDRYGGGRPAAMTKAPPPTLAPRI
jgi:hypothetical protein